MTVLIIVIDGLDFDAFVETSPSFLKCMRLAGEIPTWDDIIAQLAKHSQQFAVLYTDKALTDWIIEETVCAIKPRWLFVIGCSKGNALLAYPHEWPEKQGETLIETLVRAFDTPQSRTWWGKKLWGK